MAISKVVFGTSTLIDLTMDDVTAANVASGKKFHLADGSSAVGTNTWDAEKLFLSHNFTDKLYINRYFEPYNVYCPSCQGTCYCDANIVWKIV